MVALPRSSSSPLAFLLIFYASTFTRAAGGKKNGNESFDKHTSETFVTRMGRAIPLGEVQLRLPEASSGLLSTIIYELSDEHVLIAAEDTISIFNLTSPVTIRSRHPCPDVTINGIVRRDACLTPRLRRGRGYTFVYDSISGALLTAWGPRLQLLPLDSSRHPGVFLNAFAVRPHHNVDVEIPVSAKLRDVRTAAHQSNGGSESLTQGVDASGLPGTARQQFDSDAFFDLLLAFDSSYCQIHGNSYVNVTQVLYAVVQNLYEMNIGELLDIRLGSIDGYCEAKDDPYGRPDMVVDGVRGCSMPGLILSQFRLHGAKKTEVHRDAAYLFTGYEDGTPVIGAAYTAAACNINYAYGWIEGTTLSSILLAHEIGHTIGASHDFSGVMRPILSLDGMKTFSASSQAKVYRFVRRLGNERCFQLRRGREHKSLHDTKSLIARVRLNEATDITFAEPWTNSLGNVTTNAFQLYSGMLHGQQHRVCSSILYTERDFRGDFGSMKTDMHLVLPRTNSSVKAGGGIAVRNIGRGISQKDLTFMYMRNHTHGLYRTAFRFRQLVMMGDWSEEYETPRLGSNITSVGITIGDIHRRGQCDLIVAFVNTQYGVNTAGYIVGFGMNENGWVAGGWSELYPIANPRTSSIGDIGVDLYDTTDSGRLDIVISLQVRGASNWETVIMRAKNVQDNGNVLGAWFDMNVRLRKGPSDALKMTGGIALTRFGGSQPTLLVQQSRMTHNRSHIWLEIGYDLLSEKRRTESAGDYQAPVESCESCYNGHNILRCRQLLSTCYLERTDFNMETVLAQTSVRGMVHVRDAPRMPSRVQNGTLHCTGFHDIYVTQGQACGPEPGPERLATIGARVILMSMLNETDPFTYTGLKSNTRLEKRHVSPGTGVSGPNQVPRATTISFSSNRELRKSMIRAQLRRLTQKADFADAFRRRVRRRIVRRRGGRFYYRFIFSFTEKAKKGFLQFLLDQENER